MIILIVCLCMTTLTEDFPCFFFSCKANARVKPEKPGHGPHSSQLLCCSIYFLCCSMQCLFCVVLCIVCVYMCTVLLPPGGYPIAVKYIISYHISYHIMSSQYLALFVPGWCNGVCAPLYLRRPEDDASAPKHVGVISNLRRPQFVIPLGAIVGKRDCPTSSCRSARTEIAMWWSPSRPELFWVVTQRVAEMSYRRFGTSHRSNLQGTRMDSLLDS